MTREARRRAARRSQVARSRHSFSLAKLRRSLGSRAQRSAKASRTYVCPLDSDLPLVFLKKNEWHHLKRGPSLDTIQTPSSPSVGLELEKGRASSSEPSLPGVPESTRSNTLEKGSRLDFKKDAIYPGRARARGRHRRLTRRTRARGGEHTPPRPRRPPPLRPQSPTHASRTR